MPTKSIKKVKVCLKWNARHVLLSDEPKFVNRLTAKVINEKNPVALPFLISTTCFIDRLFHHMVANTVWDSVINV